MLVEGFFCLVFIIFSLYLFDGYRQSKRLTYIELYTFRSAISRKVKMKYPHLSDKQLLLVFEGL